MNKFNSPLEAFFHWEQSTPDKVFLKQPLNGQVREWTFKSAGDEMRRIASAIKELDYPAQSKIAILSKNCAEWVMADLAIMMTGHVSVPLYPTLGAETIKIILDHSDTRAIFIGKLDDYSEQKEGIPDIHKIGIRAYGIEEQNTWEDLVENNAPLLEAPKEDTENLWTIMYTSGTTGAPKGVMHTIGNVARTISIAEDVIPLPEYPRFFSYLPLSHVAERVAVEIHGIFRGASIGFPQSIDTFAADLSETKPHLFFAVPRIWSKFQEKIHEKMPPKKLDRLLGIPLLGGFIKKKIVKKLGLYEAMFIASGAAPIASSLQDWFNKLGITIHQCYGMTEDCILSHYNLPGTNRNGTVGKSVPGVTAKLSEHDEICIKSEVLMKGYYKEPELTSQVFDDEGYLKTGDIGEYDHDGFLTITGRVKDQFKTDKGKYISPGPIELELLKDTDLEQVCLVGMGIPQPIALAQITPTALSKSKEDLAKSLNALLESVNPLLDVHEKIEKIVIMKEEWSIANGLLTPTLKVRRNLVEKIHMGFYKSWFDSDKKVIFESSMI